MSDYYDSELELLDDVVVLTLAGVTDLATVPQVRRGLDEALEVTSGDVVLDLTDLELIDSSALGIMIAAAGRLMTEQRTLVLVVSREHVLRVLAITGLLGFFSVAATRTEALTRLSSAPVSRKAGVIIRPRMAGRTHDRYDDEGGFACCSGYCF